jgi:hypothetical protein
MLKSAQGLDCNLALLQRLIAGLPEAGRDFPGSWERLLQTFTDL